MEERQVKVGDVVAWADVPSGALVRGSWGGRDYFIERHRWRYWVKNENNAWWAAEKVAPALRAANLDTLVTIVDLDVPADATADDLRELAERFEVRQFLTYGDPRLARVEQVHHAVEDATYHYLGDIEGKTHREIKDIAADLLYRAGWRPGMSAEDATRLLADRANHARKITDRERSEAQRLIDADLNLGCPDGLGCELCFDQDEPA